jgi:G patch domain-containing protein 1
VKAAAPRGPARHRPRISGATARAPRPRPHLAKHPQEATDEQGRRRFHGAFTGGFSAGYYNTVGSKEGWAPSAFVSSRSARADASSRRDARDYMDADELAEVEGAEAGALATRKEYDTFGTAATQAAHAAADRERAVADGERPAVLPGAVFSDLVVPVSDPIGSRLLRKMGWRAGKGIGRKGATQLATGAAPPAAGAEGVPDAAGSAARASRLAAAVEALQAGEEVVIVGEEAEAHDEAAGADADADEGGEADDGQAAATAQRLRRRRRRWGGVAGALADDVRVEVPPPKRDTYGLGYDPFSGAEEFRAIKRKRGELAAPSATDPHGKRSRGSAFGVGIFEAGDDDVYGGPQREETHFEIAAGSDDEDEAARFGGALAGRAPPRLALGAATTRLALGAPVQAGMLPGFVVAAAVEPPPKLFPPPAVPRGWQPQPKFTTPLSPPMLSRGGVGGSSAPPPPPAPPPPADEELVKRCDTLADFVARNGPGFEDLARARQRDDPRFAFLFGGPGAEYYAWRCSQLRAAPAPQRPEQRSRPLTAEERGRILGEERLPAEPAPWQQTQGGALAPPAALPPPPPPPPPPKGIAQGDRAALLASLGRTFTSETKPSGTQPATVPQTYGLRPGVNLLANKFASGGTILPGAPEEAGAAKAGAAAEAPPLPPPTRVSEDWGPEPLLCKRLGVPDPYKGRTRPAERRTFRTDSFELPETAQEAADAAPKFLAAPEPAAVAAAAPPPAPAPPPLSFLPPPPPLPVGGQPPSERAAPPSAQPLPSVAAGVVDSTTLADDFFASLGGPGAPPAALEEPAPVAMRPAAKPIDLFKAIFEADDDDDGDDDNEPDGELAAVPAAPLGPVAPTEAADAAAGSRLLPAPPSGPFAALAVLAREHEDRRRKEKAKKKEHKKHKSKKDKKEKKERKEKKEKKKHVRRSRSRSSSSSSSSG